MSQLSFLDSVISATVNGSGGGFPVKSGPAVIVSQSHGPSSSGCANVAYVNGRSSMFSVLKAPWHGQGVVIDQAATSDEALKFANLAGWNLEKLPLWVDFNCVKVEVPGQFAIVRGDTGAVLGTVGDRYQIVSNEAVFDFADHVFGEFGARYETAGALGVGEKVWMLAKMPESQQIAGGDEIQPYVFFSTSHDGSSSIRAFPTSVRVVCQNTYNAAQAAGRGQGISMRHTNNVKRNIESARRALGLAVEDCKKFADVSRGLAAKPFTPAQSADLFDICLDDIVDVTVAGQRVTGRTISNGEAFRAAMEITEIEQRQKSLERIEKAQAKRRDLLNEIIAIHDGDRCNGMPEIAGSAWSAVNAVSEFVQHGGEEKNGLRYKGSDQQRGESRMLSILDGRAQAITQAAVEYAVRA